jgi:hypothetical protein
MNLDWKIIALFLVGLLLWWFFFLSISHAAKQRRTAMPLHQLIVIVFGILALVCIGGGIYAIVANARSKTELSILGAHLTAGHVGAGFVAIGIIIALFVVRAVLKKQRGH